MNFSKKIVVDLDSTLNDLMYKWLEYGNKKNNTNFKISDVKKYNDDLLLSNFDFVENSKLYDVLKPLPGAQEFIKEISKSCFVVICSVTPQNHTIGKAKFIEKYFPNVCYDFVESSKEKHKNCALIDDSLDHIKKHCGDGFLFTNGEYTYNIDENVPHGGYAAAFDFLKQKGYLN